MTDLLEIKDLGQHKVIPMKCVPTTHMLADILTKEMHMTNVCKSFLESGKYEMHQTIKEAEHEEQVEKPRKATEAPQERKINK